MHGSGTEGDSGKGRAKVLARSLKDERADPAGSSMIEMIKAGVPSTKPGSKRNISMKSGARDQAEGKWHQVKGKVKEVSGKQGDNPDLEVEGKNEGRSGEVQEKIGEIKKVVGK